MSQPSQPVYTGFAVQERRVFHPHHDDELWVPPWETSVTIQESIEASLGGLLVEAPLLPSKGEKA